MPAKQKTDKAFEPALNEQFCRRCLAFVLKICRAGIEAFSPEKTVALPGVEQTGWSVSARRLICREQDVAEVVPIVCNGWAAWYVNLPDGSRQIISFILPGEFISAAAIFDPIQYCWIEAITDCQIRTFKRNELIQALFKRRGAFEKISQIWSEEKKRADQQIVDLGRRPAQERIARLIMQLIERVKARGTAGHSPEQIPFPLRHHHIADATGLTSVHVSKVLSEHRNILVIRNRSLSIVDPIAFSRLAGTRPGMTARER